LWCSVSDAEAGLASAEVSMRLIKRVVEVFTFAILTVLFGPGLRLEAPDR
jgi:hypothetical protein